MAEIKQLRNVPEYSFIENRTLEQTEKAVWEAYAQFYREATGENLVMDEADPRNLLIKAFSLIEYQTMQYIDAKGRAEMLKTSTGGALDNLAALFGIARNAARRARTVIRFTMSRPRLHVTAVPAGTRVKTQSGKYFHTLDYVEIPAEGNFVDAAAQAEEAGSGSNGVLAGDVNLLVDPIPYIGSVENTCESTGGLDVESDESLTARIYLAPSKFSCAGPRDAYEYYVREWRGDVADVQVTSPEPGVVALYVVLNGGRLPGEAEREELEAYINGEELRPLCDKVVCLAPEERPYEIDVSYWIGRSEQRSAGAIQKNVAEAVEAYQEWQRTLGRDINPTELIARIRDAGAKRVRVRKPEDVFTERTQLPVCVAAHVIYGGLEDD